MSNFRERTEDALDSTDAEDEVSAKMHGEAVARLVALEGRISETNAQMVADGFALGAGIAELERVLADVVLTYDTRDMQDVSLEKIEAMQKHIPWAEGIGERTGDGVEDQGAKGSGEVDAPPIQETVVAEAQAVTGGTGDGVGDSDTRTGVRGGGDRGDTYAATQPPKGVGYAVTSTDTARLDWLEENPTALRAWDNEDVPYRQAAGCVRHTYREAIEAAISMLDAAIDSAWTDEMKAQVTCPECDDIPCSCEAQPEAQTSADGLVEDGFGSKWSAKCCLCGGKMMVMRPGDARCEDCDSDPEAQPEAQTPADEWHGLCSREFYQRGKAQPTEDVKWECSSCGSMFDKPQRQCACGWKAEDAEQAGDDPADNSDQAMWKREDDSACSEAEQWEDDTHKQTREWLVELCHAVMENLPNDAPVPCVDTVKAAGRLIASLKAEVAGLRGANEILITANERLTSNDGDEFKKGLSDQVSRLKRERDEARAVIGEAIVLLGEAPDDGSEGRYAPLGRGIDSLQAEVASAKEWRNKCERSRDKLNDECWRWKGRFKDAVRERDEARAEVDRLTAQLAAIPCQRPGHNKVTDRGISLDCGTCPTCQARAEGGE